MFRVLDPSLTSSNPGGVVGIQRGGYAVGVGVDGGQCCLHLRQVGLAHNNAVCGEVRVDDWRLERWVCIYRDKRLLILPRFRNPTAPCP